jgi:hypothetical protein
MIVYALFNDKNVMVKCSDSRDDVSNYFVPNKYPTEIWNKLFVASASQREYIFSTIGWTVRPGYFWEEDRSSMVDDNKDVPESPK